MLGDPEAVLVGVDRLPARKDPDQRNGPREREAPRRRRAVGLDVAGDAIDVVLADVGEERDRVRFGADQDAETPAAQEADPMAQLNAEALELELRDDCSESLRVTRADCGAQALELGGF